MQNLPLVIRHYKEEHYSTFFNPNTGFFARVEDPNHDEPFWSKNGPELIDISITNWCDKECLLCYRRSNKCGKHISLENYEEIMRQAKNMQVLQVALGGGNPNQHPHFCEILDLTRRKYGIVPNYTTNGRGLTRDVLKASKEHCGAVAVSAYSPYEETEKAIDALTSYGIKTNIHMILNKQSIYTAISWLEKPPYFLDKINAIIFLNYKPIGRFASHDLLLNTCDKLEYFFQLVMKKNYKFKIGFDACSATGVARFTNTPSMCYESCDSGRFSMFVSEDMKMYPCSFMVESGFEGIPIIEGNMLDSWRDSKPFKEIRSKLAIKGCNGCLKEKVCLGGCPVFQEISLCPEQQDRFSKQKKTTNVNR